MDDTHAFPDVSPVRRPRPGAPPRTPRPVLAAMTRALLDIAVVVAVYYLLPLNRPFGWGTVAELAGGVAAIGLLVAWQIRAIVSARFPALRAVEALALAVPLFLTMFAAVYVVLDTSEPGAFSETLTRTDGLYFVVTVFSTVGFGDITPVSQVARMLVTTQMVGDLVLIGLVVRAVLTAVQRGRSGIRRAPADTAAGKEEPPR